jgi:hypothetical protein
MIWIWQQLDNLAFRFRRLMPQAWRSAICRAYDDRILRLLSESDAQRASERHDKVRDEPWVSAADWLEAHGEHELTRQQYELTRRMYLAGLIKRPPTKHIESVDPWLERSRADSSDHYPPPLRRPTGDER